jgi:hypothetical protein
MRLKKCFNAGLAIVVFTIGCSNGISTVEDNSAKKIVLTEIMYNTGVDSLEYIEMKNVSSSSISLKGMFFKTGIQYVFADTQKIKSGEYIILTNSEELFTKKYSATPITGIFSGRLDNDGEEIELCEENLNKVFSCKYKNSGFWPALADGFGYSLVTSNENDPGDQNDYNDWSASLSKSGSPGYADNPPNHIPIYVNELIISGLMSRTDTIELYNPDSSTAVDISNWFLTDNRKDPKKFRIPSGTIIQPHGYTVFAADQFKNDFSILTSGGSIYIFSANDDSSFSGFSHGIDYEEADSGTSFGLIKNSDGHYFASRLTTSTIGSSNSQPVSSDLVISEIMYNPLSGGTEFIEIVNMSTDDVTFSSQGTPWKIDGISFDFPIGVSLNKDGLLVIIGSETSIAAFRSSNKIDSTITVLQYAGKLSNGGETITIERPGSAWVDSDGSIQHSYISIDAVSYKDESPWPKGADGKGYSLVRKSLSSWGNEPENWKKSENTGGSPGKL